MRAKKSLGQHFLTSTAARNHIREAADVNGADIILEIGPGRGFLTETLLAFVGKVIAIEKDAEIIPFLTEKFAKEIAAQKLEIIEKDILEFDPEVLRFYDLEYKVVANIPYYITGAIIKQFLSAAYQPERMVLLVQKEVAERIVARDGKESILSISVKAYGTPEYIQTVKAGSFNPPPQVDSAILRISTISKDFFRSFSEEHFFTVLKTGFAHKRKYLSSNLAEVFPKDAVMQALHHVGLNEKVRAEDVTLEQWQQLATALQA
jgi:16S rRNA (adenine1518-N6/adenine1519-N6)-dimethyltransferase